MRFTIGLITMGVSVSAHGGHHHHHHRHSQGPVSPVVQRAANYVEQMCSMDVVKLCPSPDDWMKQVEPVMLKTVPSSSGGPSDPVVDFLFNPMAPPPMMLDISQVLDDMMKTAMVLSQQPTFSMIIVKDIDTSAEIDEHKVAPPKLEHEPEKHMQQMHAEAPTTPAMMFETLFSTMAEKVATTQEEPSAPALMDPVALATRIVQHGNEILESEQDDEDRRSMARRLTEVRPEMFHAHGPRHHLPFGCKKNRCLLRAYDENAVSPGCFNAIKSFKEAETVAVRREALRTAVKAQTDRDTFFTFAMLYFFLALGTMFLLHRRFGKFRRTVQEHRRLNERVLQAVYSNPRIKEALESELNENIGFVPPLPPHVLARMGGRRLFGPGFMICQFLKLLSLFCVLVLICVNPFLAMPLLCIFMLMRCCHLSCCTKDMPHELSCSCCCCNLSTDDVKRGLVSAAQECCSCCKGTGVCAPGCDDCCGDNPCHCCDDGCDCCDGGSSPKTPNKEVDCCDDNDDECGTKGGCCGGEDEKKEVVTAVPIQVV